jgi:prepilin-type N-terminal cleavage/methylation domain-containing protein
MSTMSGHRLMGTQASAACGPAGAKAREGRTGGTVGMIEQIRTGARRASSLRDGGFTLIESLTASAILLVIAVAVVTTLVTTGGWYAKARTRTEASAIANQVMSLILARNYSDIHYAQGNEAWPAGIQESMPWDSTYGQFTVETSMTPTNDPSTGIPMLQVIVTAFPKGQPLEPAVQVIRYASGWQDTKAAITEKMVHVRVQLRVVSPTPGKASGSGGGTLAGVRVQLLDASTLAESGRWALTDAAGVADFGEVPEAGDGYFLTSDPRFGSAIRPLYFPERKYPTRGGSATPNVVTYQLDVVHSATAAVLRVGAYRNDGIVKQGSDFVSTTPYQPVYGLTVYAKPSLNDGSSTLGVLGAGSRYPDASILPDGGVYSATVNAYGVAVIQIPWTLSGSAQSWTCWCYTKDKVTGQVVKHTLTDYAFGSWAEAINQPDLPSDGDYSKVPMWNRLGDVLNATGP